MLQNQYVTNRRRTDQRPVHHSPYILLCCSISTQTGELDLCSLNDVAEIRANYLKNSPYSLLFLCQNDLEKAHSMYSQIMSTDSKLCQNFNVSVQPVIPLYTYLLADFGQVYIFIFVFML